MPIDTDDEILQDFLVEASEILERLGEQLVDLEQRPQDKELLNAVFRGFHTVKGGAGFLALTALVEVCHRAEDVFNTLRQGERLVDAKLMDVFLRVLDVVNSMMDQVRRGEEPGHADPLLLQQLETLAKPAKNGEPIVTSTEATSSITSVSSEKSVKKEVHVDEKDSAEKDFEAMIDAVAEHTKKESSPASDEDITEEEFELLLDQLNNSKKHEKVQSNSSQKNEISKVVASASDQRSDEITDAEFENLLDTLQSKEQAKNSPTAKVKSEVSKEQVKVIQSELREAPPPPEKDEGNATAKNAMSKEPQAETTVRVDTKRLDDIMNLVGELVLVRNRLATLKASMDEQVAKAVANLDLVTADLQNAVMKTRMQPIKKVFGRFPRVVRDLARSLNKQVNLELQGEDTDLDKNLVEALADPLVHLVRNSVDHGIESPEARRKAGKPAAGTVVLAAEQEGDHILLSIEDDGAGMNPEVLRRKAVEKGLMDEDAAARLDDRSCYNLIFLPGFSTKSEISDISGRGVGMDVVKTRISQLNGTVEIDSQLGKGTRIAIKVPLTLAIMPTLMVQLGKQIFALPLANVIEIFDRDSAKTSTVDGKKVVIVRDKALPLVQLCDWLVRNPDPAINPGGYVVVVSFGAQNVGCIVDQLIGQEEVVIKPLGSMLHGTRGLAGATITGNGRIALILDLPSLMTAYARR